MMEGFEWGGATSIVASEKVEFWYPKYQGLNLPHRIILSDNIPMYRVYRDSVAVFNDDRLCAAVPTLEDAKHIAEIYYLTAIK